MKTMNSFLILSLFILSFPIMVKGEDELVLKMETNLNLSTPSQVTPFPADGNVEDTHFPKEDFLNMPALPKTYSYEELKKIRNDKEPLLSAFGKFEKDRIKTRYSENNEKLKIQNVFLENLHGFLNGDDSHCELKYISTLAKELEAARISYNYNEMVDVFKMLRVSNAIDDVYYDILENLAKDYFAFEELNLTSIPLKKFFKVEDKKISNDELDELFAKVKILPDESSSCLYSEVVRLKERSGKENDTQAKKIKILKDNLVEALNRKVISLEVYKKINFVLSDSTLFKRKVWLNDYFKIIFSAKNSMTPFARTYKVLNLEDENAFSSEKIERFSRITRRKLLYQKYNEDQVIILALIMKRASQRMGVDPDTKTKVPYLVQEFSVTKGSGEVENIVEKIELDTQSQFNLARRLLRKDIVTLQMTKSFQPLKITYDDIVLAALETGYISLEDMQYVVQYDDLWNPAVSKNERMAQFGFRIAGYGTFFLPPPWNITAGLALTIVEGIVDSKNINGAKNDNPNTFIE